MIQSRSPYQSEITLKDGQIHVIGSLTLIQRVSLYRTAHGSDPKRWPVLTECHDTIDLLLNEFILKVKDQFKLDYDHAELCHCRMVPALKVYDAIKQGCASVEEVGRATLAGTSCGSCRPDIQKLLNQFKLKKEA